MNLRRTSQYSIFHNPDCGTSRNTLALIRASGVEPEVIEYLKMPPDRETLKALVARMGMQVRDVLRVKGTPYKELGLDGRRIDLAHQLADVLHLAPAGFHLEALRRAHGLIQGVGQRHLLQAIGGQRNELLTKILQRMHLTLAAALAGRFDEVFFLVMTRMAGVGRI